MTNNPIKTRPGSDVFRIILNNPPNRNALSIAMLEAIRSALEDAANSKARIIVISATGNVFCPGHDLKEMAEARKNPDRGKAFFEETMSLCSKVMQAIVNHPLPVIAEISGIATAAGCQLVASCDLAVAGNGAKFATPGVHIGLFCSTPMVALSRNVSRKHAMEMLLTGKYVSAKKAQKIGLINKAVPARKLDATVRKYTDAIVSKSSVTLKIGKQAFYQQAEMPLARAYDHCSRVMVENMMKRDAEEGINAFIEKRDPEWQDA